MEEGDWVLEVEEALLDEAPPEQLRLLLAGRPLPASLRADVWLHCLESEGRRARIDRFDEVYDHPAQSEIRQMAAGVAGGCPQLQADTESLLTAHYKGRPGEEVTAATADLLRPLAQLQLSRQQRYTVFQSLLDRFVPNCECGAVFDLARLVLLYHDPELCSLLDSAKLAWREFSTTWLSSLLAADCRPEVTQQLWDILIVQGDPWLMVIMVVVLVASCRDSLLEAAGDRVELLARLAALPGQIEPGDVADLGTLAQVYSSRTPASYKTVWAGAVFTRPGDLELAGAVKAALCLPVNADEVLASELVSCQFFVVDCRPAEQYNCGHLARAQHLDCSLMLRDPAQFTTACQALLAFQQAGLSQQTGAGEHLVFLGGGSSSEAGQQEVEANMLMAVSRLLQQNTKYISVLAGGYPAFQPAAPATPAPAPQPSAPSDPSRLDNLKSNIKHRSAGLKESLLQYITSPGGQQQEQPRHVEHSKRGSKLYKGTADVFCLEDEEEEGLVELGGLEPGTGDTVHLAACQRVGETGLLAPCHLLVTTSQLTVLVPGPRPGTAHQAASRHLSSIVKITSKKRQPEIITFKFGTSQNDEVTVFDMDRFYIPTAGKVTAVVKQQIERLKES